MKYRIINTLLIITLILLFSAFIFPFLRYEILPSHYVAFIWIWGGSIIPMMVYEYFFFGFFWLCSGGIIVEIIFLLKSSFIIRKEKIEIEMVSRSWKKRGVHIIIYELIWILQIIFLFYIFRPNMYGELYFNLYIEIPIFFPLISGILLIITRILSRKLDDQESKNDYVDLKWLENQYYELKRSVQEIANEQNVSMITIKNLLEKINRK
ncbi:MAG: hypothetical protein ACFE96_03780 [Candidatus Hermodarchaeota archaeon]